MARRRTQRSRSRRSFLPRSVLIACGAFFGIFLMLGVSWQAHRCAELRRDCSRLERTLRFEEDQQRRLRGQWHDATSRERIVLRAFEELGLAEHRVEQKELVAFAEPVELGTGGAFLRSVRDGLDRYGTIGSAAAGEERP